MAVTAFATGTSSSTVGTEVFLSNPNQAGTYIAQVLATNMGTADVVELRWYAKTLTGGGTSDVAYYQRFAGQQPTDDEVKISVPISTELTDTNSLRFSLKQTAGPARSFDWKILKFA